MTYSINNNILWVFKVENMPWIIIKMALFENIPKKYGLAKWDS